MLSMIHLFSIVRPGAHTCLCVFTLMWSHPGDLGVHVCLCVCMLVYSHPGQTSLQLRWACLSLMPKAKASSRHASPPCSSTRPRGEGATGKEQLLPLITVTYWLNSKSAPLALPHNFYCHIFLSY